MQLSQVREVLVNSALSSPDVTGTWCRHHRQRGTKHLSHVHRDYIQPVRLYLEKSMSITNPLVHSLSCLDSFLPALPTHHLTSAINSEVLAQALE